MKTNWFVVLSFIALLIFVVYLYMDYYNSDGLFVVFILGIPYLFGYFSRKSI